MSVQQQRQRNQRPAPGQASPQEGGRPAPGQAQTMGRGSVQAPTNGQQQGQAQGSKNDKMVVYETGSGKVSLSPSIVKRYLVSGDSRLVTDQEVMMFLALCRFQKLNPFLREAYLIKFGSEPATIVTGKEVFTKRASANQLCDGWEAGVVVLMEDGTIAHRNGTLVLPREDLVGGYAKVYRKDWAIPMESVVGLNEYRRLKKDGSPMASWGKMPATMIRKVALVQALREAFTSEYQGMYSEEEMPVDTEALNRQTIVVEGEYAEVDPAEEDHGEARGTDVHADQPAPEPPPQSPPPQQQQPTLTPQQQIYASANAFADSYTFDPVIYKKAVDMTITGSLGVQDITAVTPAQWRGIAKNVDGLLERASHTYKQMTDGGAEGAPTDQSAEE